MTDDSPEPGPERNPPQEAFSSCVWLLGGFIIAGGVGLALAFWAAIAKGPGWLIPLAFFGPGVAFLLVFGATAIPRLIRQAREAARNAPSPESAAAAAAGEGVEAGLKAKPITTEDRDEFPTIEIAKTQPGRTLSHRIIRAGMAASCQFGCFLFLAVFWNGIVGVFVYQLFIKWNRGGVFQWLEALFLSPFALIGLVLIGATLYAALNWFVFSLVGQVEVELSDHPLVVGSRAHLNIAQSGLVPLARVSVWLICTEEATYVAGTSKSTAKKEIAKHLIADPDENPSGGGLPLAAEFTVPHDAMHSFDAPNNKLNWTVRVTGRVLGVLPYRDDYSVTIIPG